MQKQATFTAMTDGTPADYAIIGKANGEHAKALADRILDHLALLKGDTGGFAIDRYRHCLQTATRAYRDGRDNEYVVCALLHDIGDTLASANHADLAATMLEPFVSEENYGSSNTMGFFKVIISLSILVLIKICGMNIETVNIGMPALSSAQNMIKIPLTRIMRICQ